MATKIIRPCAYCGGDILSRGTQHIYCSLRCKGLASRQDPVARFWAKVTRTDECWLWQPTMHSHRYGKIWVDGAERSTHVFAYQLQRGHIPPGLFVLHSCDVKACVRGSHLFLGTHADNMHDKTLKGRCRQGVDHHMRRRPELVRHGERVPWHKLTEDDVRTIRTERAAGTTVIALAERYSFTPNGIYAIVNRKTWKHV